MYDYTPRNPKTTLRLVSLWSYCLHEPVPLRSIFWCITSQNNIKKSWNLQSVLTACVRNKQSSWDLLSLCEIHNLKYKLGHYNFMFIGVNSYGIANRYETCAITQCMPQFFHATESTRHLLCSFPEDEQNLMSSKWHESLSCWISGKGVKRSHGFGWKNGIKDSCHATMMVR